MSKPAVTGTLLHAGVDWLTVTQADGSRAEMMQGLARFVIEAEAQAGQIVRDWQWRGYTGEATPQFTWGRRADGLVVRLVGATAQQYWRRFARLGKSFPRIDLQATVRLDPPDFRLGAFHRLEGTNAEALGHRHATITSIDTHEGGYTLYVGRRASDAMARIYDKTAQAPTLELAPGTWRYEVEYKRHVGQAVVQRLLSQPEGIMPVLAILHAHLTRRGLTPTFPSVYSDYVQPTPRHTDEETRLRWLAEAVRPTLDWLRSRGRTHELRSILGFNQADEGDE